MFSTPPWCQAGRSRKPSGLSRDRLLSGGDLKSGPSGRLGRKRPRAPRKRGACAAVKTAALPQAARRPCRLARGALRPIPPPFPAREGGEGSRIRCGGEPLRRDGGFSHRTADFYRFAPYLLASRMRSAYKGCQLPPVSTTHAQEAARVVDGETRGVRGVGRVVGAGARRAGRPGSRRGRKAPGRLPGRLLLWASAPPRLTSCRQCGKMLHEGSHRRRSQRRPSSKVRQKPGRFRNDRALRFAPVGSSRLYSKKGQSSLPPFRMGKSYHTTAAYVNLTSCDRACD